MRNRIQEIITVAGRDLLPAPSNFRRHTNGQREALRGILGEVGVADVLKAWRRPDGALQLVDGHLRADEFPDQAWTVAVLDVDEKEAAYLLATMDPVGALAETDTAVLDELLQGVETEDAAVREMLADLMGEPDGSGGGAAEGDAEVLLDQAVQLKPSREYAVIVCNSDVEWERLKRVLDLGPVRRGGYKRGSMFDDVSTQRVVMAGDVLERMEGGGDAGRDSE